MGRLRLLCHTSTSPYSFLAWCLIACQHRDIFRFPHGLFMHGKRASKILWTIFHLPQMFYSLLAFLGGVAKLRKATIRFVMFLSLSVHLSFRPHWTTRFPLDGFSWNLIWIFRKKSVGWIFMKFGMYFSKKISVGWIFMKFDMYFSKKSLCRMDFHEIGMYFTQKSVCKIHV